MAAPIHQKEDVRLLAIQHGIRETARLTGINPNTLLSWSKRYQWFKQPPSVTRQNGGAISAIKASVDAVASEHEANKQRSKTALGKYAAQASEAAAKHKNKLKIARAVRDVAAVHSSLWPEDHNERGLLNVNVLAGNVALQIKGESNT